MARREDLSAENRQSLAAILARVSSSGPDRRCESTNKQKTPKTTSNEAILAAIRGGGNGAFFSTELAGLQ
jgi:hypothetical protein